MKTIVAIVSPAPEKDHSSGPENARDLAQGVVTETPAVPEGAMRLEATVTDAVANKIMGTILNLLGAEPFPDATLDDLLQRELAAAGPDACNLYNRIVSRIEERLLHQVYAECDGVKTRTADRLGINRNTLYKMLKQHHLEAHDE
ncbi:helix-turn-helix domain-containing protein [Planctomicrobium piriforme]|uniref:Regulatory protein, Fis family n=1 Tax=Planctomicrobium piriforme TaxID=1576369 RepID=A0A1I3NJT0_9PLAN|nr:helix-turn-helix domain-containing protein [Planctomicrobium piriforme]SFJ09427.1 regulatory protein, Fis family [Planctomicrobium piriforme]